MKTKKKEEAPMQPTKPTLAGTLAVLVDSVYDYQRAVRDADAASKAVSEYTPASKFYNDPQDAEYRSLRRTEERAKAAREAACGSVRESYTQTSFYDRGAPSKELVAQLRSDLEATLRDKASAATALRESEKKAAEAQKALDAASDAFRKTTAKVTAQYDEEKQHIEQLRSEIKDVRTENEVLRVTKNALEVANAKALTEVKRMQDIIDGLKDSAITVTEQGVGDEDSQVASLNMRVEQLRKHCGDLDTMMTSSKLEAGRLRVALAEMTKDRDEARTEIAALREQRQIARFAEMEADPAEKVLKALFDSLLEVDRKGADVNSTIRLNNAWNAAAEFLNDPEAKKE